METQSWRRDSLQLGIVDRAALASVPVQPDIPPPSLRARRHVVVISSLDAALREARSPHWHRLRSDRLALDAHADAALEHRRLPQGLAI